MELHIVENEEKKRFETRVADKIAKTDFIKTKTTIYLTHTEVPPELEGFGVGTSLVEQVLERIRNQKLKLAPLCPFVAKYIIEHPEWQDILAKGYKVG